MISNDVKNKIQAQQTFCNEKKWPHFAPSNGICYGCGLQIYEKTSLEYASSFLITGCPWCSRSYCD